MLSPTESVLLLLTIQFLSDLPFNRFDIKQYQNYLSSCKDPTGNQIYNLTDDFLHESFFLSDIINYININSNSKFVISSNFSEFVKLQPESLYSKLAIKESEIYFAQKEFEENVSDQADHLVKIKNLYSEYVEIQKLIESADLDLTPGSGI
jgi:hypothetical protein